MTWGGLEWRRAGRGLAFLQCAPPVWLSVSGTSFDAHSSPRY